MSRSPLSQVPSHRQVLVRPSWSDGGVRGVSLAMTADEGRPSAAMSLARAPAMARRLARVGHPALAAHIVAHHEPHEVVAYLDGIDVPARLRRQGLGSALVRAAAESGRASKAVALYLNAVPDRGITDAALVPFYRNLGMTRPMRDEDGSVWVLALKRGREACLPADDRTRLSVRSECDESLLTVVVYDPLASPGRETVATLEAIRSNFLRPSCKRDAAEVRVLAGLPSTNRVEFVVRGVYVRPSFRDTRLGSWLYAEAARLARSVGRVLVADACDGGATSTEARRAWSSAWLARRVAVVGLTAAWPSVDTNPDQNTPPENLSLVRSVDDTGPLKWRENPNSPIGGRL